MTRTQASVKRSKIVRLQPGDMVVPRAEEAAPVGQYCVLWVSDDGQCQSLGILNYYLADYLGKFLIKFKVNFLGDFRLRLV